MQRNNELINPTIPVLDETGEVQLQQFTNTFTTTKTRYLEFNTSLSTQLRGGSNFSLSPEQAKTMAEFGRNFNELGQSSLMMMQIAERCGANAKTCNALEKFGVGLHTFGQGLEKISSSGSLFNLAGMTGGLNVALGVMTIFGKKNRGNGLGKALQQFMDAINGLFQALQEVYQSIVELKNIFHENMTVIHYRLTQLNEKLDRLEGVVSNSFKELHSKEFIDIFDVIEKDLKGEYQLTIEERKDYLRRLSTWIEHHSKSPLQTSLIRESNVVKDVVKILGNENFDSSIALPFLLGEVNRLVPNKLRSNIKVDEIPNIALMNIACEFYTVAIDAYGLDDNYLPCLERTLTTITQVEALVNQSCSQPEIYEILLRQYEDIRRQVGLAIAKCRADFPSSAPADTSLENLLKNDIKSENLRILLDQLELRRLLLKQLSELTHDASHHYDKISKLESKQTILSRPKKFYDAAAEKFLTASWNGDINQFKLSIQNGADINAWNGWGQAIHYVCMQNKEGRGQIWSTGVAAQMLHYLFREGEKVQQYDNGSISNWPNTWGSGIKPLKMILNNSFFENAVLWCAQGNEIVEHYNDFYNALLWANENNWNCIVQKYLVRDMNNPAGVINKADLRKAYQFYKSIEAGETVSSEGINQDCILWLVTILGNLEVIKAFNNFNADVNKAIPITNFTPLMMAVYCGHPHVVDYLIARSARTDVTFAVRDPGPRDWHPNYVPTRDVALNDTYKPYLLWIATNWGLLSVSQKLIAAGLVPNAAQRQIITEMEAKAATVVNLPANPVVVHVPAIERTINPTKEMLENSKQRLMITIASLNQKNQLALEAAQEEKGINRLPPIEQELHADLMSVKEQCDFFYGQITEAEYKNIPEGRLPNLSVSINNINEFILTLKPLESLAVLKIIFTQFNQLDALLRRDPAYVLGQPISNFLTGELRPLIKRIEKNNNLNARVYNQGNNQHSLFAQENVVPVANIAVPQAVNLNMR